jgi:hypothetical protein
VDEVDGCGGRRESQRRGAQSSCVRAFTCLQFQFQYVPKFTDSQAKQPTNFHKIPVT